MISEREVWEAAVYMVREYGDLAPRRALRLADAMKAEGNATGRFDWLRVKRAAEALLVDGRRTGRLH